MHKTTASSAKAAFSKAFLENNKLKPNFALCGGNKQFDLTKFLSQYDDLRAQASGHHTKSQIDSICDISKQKNNSS